MHIDDKIHFWFPITIYCDSFQNVSDINLYLKQKAIDLKKQRSISNTSWRCNTFNTLDQYDWKLDNDIKVLWIIENLKNKVYDFSKTFGVNIGYDKLNCTGFWFNLADHGQYQEYHQHTNSHFSLVYYVDVVENSGNIVFKSFESMFDMYSLPIKENNLNQSSFKTCSYKPNNGMFLIFRSNLLHMVERNESDRSRISISMNFTFDS